MWISHKNIYIYPFPLDPPSKPYSPPAHPSRSSRSTWVSSLCHGYLKTYFLQDCGLISINSKFWECVSQSDSVMSDSLQPHVACQALLSMGFWWDWWATVQRVGKSWTRLKRLTMHTHMPQSEKEGRIFKRYCAKYLCHSTYWHFYRISRKEWLLNVYLAVSSFPCDLFKMGTWLTSAFSALIEKLTWPHTDLWWMARAGPWRSQKLRHHLFFSSFHLGTQLVWVLYIPPPSSPFLAIVTSQMRTPLPWKISQPIIWPPPPSSSNPCHSPA